MLKRNERVRKKGRGSIYDKWEKKKKDKTERM